MGTSFDTGTNTTGRTERALATAIAPAVRPRPETTTRYQRLADEDRGTGGESLADFLGFFSIGLGLSQALMPGLLARVVGIDHADERNRTVMRLMGMREISHGLALLSNQQPEKAAWSRVAGDALDLALLGKVLANPENNRGRTLFATANVSASPRSTSCARSSSRNSRTRSRTSMPIAASSTRGAAITIASTGEEVYTFWRNFENLPRFMRHLESVTVTGDRRSHWMAKAPAGKSSSGMPKSPRIAPNELIAWRSLEGCRRLQRGHGRFSAAPGGPGNRSARRPRVRSAARQARLEGRDARSAKEPGQQVQDDLRHFKQVMETGEIVVSDATKQRGHAASGASLTPNQWTLQMRT